MWTYPHVLQPRLKRVLPVPMKSIHRMVHQADLPDGGVEWACLQCGRYTASTPREHVVVLAGEPDSVHVLGAGFPPAPEGPPTLGDFDRQFLRRHRMAW
jgi:hypothetical protein